VFDFTQPAQWAEFVTQGGYAGYADRRIGNWDFDRTHTPEFTEALLRDLTRAADRLRWADVGERAVLHITRREWDGLRWAMSPYQFRQRFDGEGTQFPRFHGIRLVIT
jgi:hypothetical protein